jgi:hypothetical protein
MECGGRVPRTSAKPGFRSRRCARGGRIFHKVDVVRPVFSVPIRQARGRGFAFRTTPVCGPWHCPTMTGSRPRTGLGPRAAPEAFGFRIAARGLFLFNRPLNAGNARPCGIGRVRSKSAQAAPSRLPLELTFAGATRVRRVPLDTRDRSASPEKMTGLPRAQEDALPALGAAACVTRCRSSVKRGTGPRGGSRLVRDGRVGHGSEEERLQTSKSWRRRRVRARSLAKARRSGPRAG